MDDLTAFIAARLDEDEAAAIAIRDCRSFHGVESDAEEEVLRFADADRQLREVTAKRRIVERHSPCDDWSYGDSSTCPELRSLAAVWSDHPDYRADWA